jgi:hypothetical protein
MTPTLFTPCNTLPPEEAAAPAARQSRFCGPCLHKPRFDQGLHLPAIALPAPF